MREVNAFLREQAQAGKVTVYTEGTFGLLPYAIEIYLVNQPNITIRGIWPVPESMPQEIQESARDHPTFFVLNQLQEAPPGWPLELIAQYSKGNRKDSRKLQFFRVALPVPKAKI